MAIGFVGSLPGSGIRQRALLRDTRRSWSRVRASASSQDVDVEQMMKELERLKAENEKMKEGRSEAPKAPAVLGNPKMGEVGSEGRPLKFESIAEGDKPVIMPFIGKMSDLTAEDIKSAKMLTAEDSSIDWLRVVPPDGKLEGRFLAAPSVYGFQTRSCSDLLAISCKASEVGFTFPGDADPEMYMIISVNEADLEFESGKFYLWNCKTHLRVGHAASPLDEEMGEPIAQALLAYFKDLKDMSKKKPFFAEGADEFVF
mmetsp:Transcript_28777/g.112209  ORF Transcript_28777/g.112209 Transcript_28777/m.112209 type:complete len:258 (-) Transcript_28777:195-968(-)|eukprot:CAMPEP_0113968658 /NCGR_PEP_ID=MMETSP0011_2-20120614/9685_1 /TAXON_ID=101924 /ORGANISM="Rhodosorus marinus" /LENGTH=257 /DNA_ID=CAMNT_0000981831 /DNA_START=744 /DNA_END=1517 /DNA_ORIENTATION=- /assembly_acc=CAM_ASM_000156